MRLSRNILAQVSGNAVTPLEKTFVLPERILQFGTGVLLRGLCDYHVHIANQEGRFNGRIVVVKSTSSGGTDAFEQQDNLYTLCVRGINNGKVAAENIICNPISRVINATDNWQQVLDLAKDPQINIVISNTTEVGLQLVEESVAGNPPASYPAKLLAFLLERYRHFGMKDAGKLIVIPTELITENGNKLRDIVHQVTAYNKLEKNFVDWLDTHVQFCNSLVDRIVTRDPGQAIINGLQSELGYEDELLTMCEDYHLWAIQGNDEVKSVLSFAGNDTGAFVKPDIEIFKSLKLHLLNGTHTLSAPLAYLAGFNTVKQAMQNDAFRGHVEKLMLEEIAPAVPFKIDAEEKNRFGRKVLDRFSNPFLEHMWLNITLHHTAKMRMRNLPILIEYMKGDKPLPVRMAIGFAAFLLFMKATKHENNIYYGERNGELYRINDEKAPYFFSLWNRYEGQPAELVKEVLQNNSLWGVDLYSYADFRDMVVNKLTSMLQKGVPATLNI